MTDERAVDGLVELLGFYYPDPVDVFEDRLASLLGIERHPWLSYEKWRHIRVRAIEAAGLLASELGLRVEAEMREAREGS